MVSNVQFRAMNSSWLRPSWGRSTGARSSEQFADLGEPIELSGGVRGAATHRPDQAASHQQGRAVGGASASRKVRIRGDRFASFSHHALRNALSSLSRAARAAFQTRSGVTGSSICSTPNSASASTIAFATAASPGVIPPSLPPRHCQLSGPRAPFAAPLG
jgi:hypothetical protein